MVNVFVFVCVCVCVSSGRATVCSFAHSFACVRVCVCVCPLTLAVPVRAPNATPSPPTTKPQTTITTTTTNDNNNERQQQQRQQQRRRHPPTPQQQTERTLRDKISNLQLDLSNAKQQHDTKLAHLDRELLAANDAALTAKDELFTVRACVCCLLAFVLVGPPRPVAGGRAVSQRPTVRSCLRERKMHTERRRRQKQLYPLFHVPRVERIGSVGALIATSVPRLRSRASAFRVPAPKGQAARRLPGQPAAVGAARSVGAFGAFAADRG